jgi:hypothetical protein
MCNRFRIFLCKFYFTDSICLLMFYFLLWLVVSLLFSLIQASISAVTTVNIIILVDKENTSFQAILVM